MSKASGLKQPGTPSSPRSVSHGPAKSSFNPDKEASSGNRTSTRIADSSQPVRGRTYTAVLVGETGSGKSTFINYLANYFLRGSLHSLKVVIPSTHYPQINLGGFPHPSEANLDDASLSQTTKAAKYTFQKDGETYHFLDTPGLSSTSFSSESAVDDESMNAILSAVSRAGELNAIILIMNGRASRLTPNLTNVLQRLAESFSDIFRDRWIVIFTNCSASTLVFDKKALPFALNRWFATDNSAFSYEPAKPGSVSPDRVTMDKEWSAAMETIKQLTAALKSLSAISTDTITTFQMGQQQLADLMNAASDLCAQIEELDKQLASSKFEEAEAAHLSRQQSSSLSTDRFNSQGKLYQAEQDLCNKTEALRQLFAQLDDSDHDLERFQDITTLGQSCSFLRFQVNFLRETLAQTKTQVRGDEDSFARKQLELSQKLSEAEERLNGISQDLVAVLWKLKQISHRVNLLTEINPSKRAFKNSISRLKTEKVRIQANEFLQRVEKSVEEINR